MNYRLVPLRLRANPRVGVKEGVPAAPAEPQASFDIKRRHRRNGPPAIHAQTSDQRTLTIRQKPRERSTGRNFYWEDRAFYRSISAATGINLLFRVGRRDTNISASKCHSAGANAIAAVSECRARCHRQ
jgi:hypothetical protein